MADVAFVVLFQDDALEVGYSDGCRLQLSPCGSEFLMEERSPGRPPEAVRRVRRRTRFVTSAHKELLLKALQFRNTFAARPYLPEELVPMDRRKFSFTDISEVQWPSLSASASCDGSFSPSGELTVASLDGNARLIVSPSGQDFSVEFLCRVSQDQASSNSPGSSAVGQHEVSKENPRGGLSDLQNRASRVSGKLRVATPGSLDHHSRTPQDPLRRTYLYTWMTQHHSCTSPPQFWCHPLALAFQVRHAATGDSPAYVGEASGLKMGSLPQALPLRCASPHQHRWRHRDSRGLQRALECDIQSELLKIVWIEGVVYRVFDGAVTMMEVFPGDGSVIRSNSTMPDYFTHCAIGLDSQATERTYHLGSLPPDVPGQPFSVRLVVARAGRILKSYSQAKLSLKLPQSHCCWQEDSDFSEASAVSQDPHVLNVGHQQDNQMLLSKSVQPGLWEQSWSVDAELKKIRRFNYLLDHSGLLGPPGGGGGN